MSVSDKFSAKKGLLLLSEVTDLLKTIDSIPAAFAATLPTMPGFDRDYVDVLVDDSTQYYAADPSTRDSLLQKLVSFESPDIDGKAPKSLELQLEAVIGWCNDWISALPVSVTSSLHITRSGVSLSSDDDSYGMRP
jgi:hypothetical protein